MAGKTGAENIESGKTSEEYWRTAEKVKRQYERYVKNSGVYDLPTGKQEPPQEQNLAPSPENPLTANKTRTIYEKEPWGEATDGESVKPGKTEPGKTSQEYWRTAKKVKPQYVRYVEPRGVYEVSPDKRKPPQKPYLVPSPEKSSDNQ